ncbi:MAG: 5'/3'-nucleotidase SurE [Phycisphaerales bacterium]|nr:MAG: 5'/3'-nucleotidase SurE [Phycisphaerales bacterium]
MRILLSNDDGVRAPGILAMAQAMSACGDVVVVAPETSQSAAAHGITLTAPLSVDRVHLDGDFPAYAVDGRPADCVKLAIRELMKKPPDLVISGINDGANTGINVLYSGTVAAAAEGAFYNFPAVAVSLLHTERMDFAGAAVLARDLIRQLLDTGLAGHSLVNINIPALEQGPPKGVRVVPQSMIPWEDYFERVPGPADRQAYWLKGDYLALKPEADTDFHAVMNGYVTITPLQFDLTHHEALRSLGEHQWVLPANPGSPPA